MCGVYWRGYRGGPARTAAVESTEGISKLTEQWCVGLRDATVLPESLRTTPHGLLVGRTDGLSVLDADTGTQRWNYTKAAPVHGVEYAEGRVYLGTDEGVVAIDSQSGAEVDTLTVDVAPVSDRPDKIAVTETTLIANTRDGIAAFDTTDGSRVWSSDGRAAEEFAVGDEHVYARFGEELRAFVIDSGRQVWTAEVGHPDDKFGDVRGARPEGVVAWYYHDGTLVGHEGVTLLSGDDGTALVGAEEQFPVAFHVVDDAALVAREGTVERRKLSDGAVVWDHSVTGSADTIDNESPRARSGETFYLGTGRQITALNTETGGQTARLQLSHPLEAMAPTGDQLFVAGGESVTAYEDQVTKVFDG